MTRIRAAFLVVTLGRISISAPTSIMHVSAKLGATGQYAIVIDGYKFDWAVGALRYA